MSPSIPIPAPRIARFESLAFGLFLHWGLYSQLGRGEWVQNTEPIASEDYARLQNSFTAADFDARAIARLARRAGQRYITLTTRHHDGFSLYDTRGLSDFDAPHSPAARDLVTEFVDACRAEEIVPFFYHTTLDWRWDSAHCSAARFDEYLDYLNASVEVLCTQYGPIGGLWFDGNWSRPDADWREDRLYQTIRRHQPDAMIINNTGLSDKGALGHPEIDSTTFEQGLPTMPDRAGWPKYVAGEMCQTLNSHWGLGARDFNYQSVGQIIENLAACRKVGANYLLNVGPTAQGAIPALERATLERVGDWVEMHQPALRARPCAVQATGRDFVLQNGQKLFYFAHDLSRDGNHHVVLAGGGAGPRAVRGLQAPIASAKWLDSGRAIEYAQNRANGLATLDLTPYPHGTDTVVRVAELTLDAI